MRPRRSSRGGWIAHGGGNFAALPLSLGALADGDEHMPPIDMDGEHVQRPGGGTEHYLGFVTAERGTVTRTAEEAPAGGLAVRSADAGHLELFSERDGAAAVSTAVPEGDEAVRAAHEMEVAQGAAGEAVARVGLEVTYLSNGEARSDPGVELPQGAASRP